MARELDLNPEIDGTYAEMWEQIMQENPDALAELEEALAPQIEDAIHTTYQQIRNGE